MDATTMMLRLSETIDARAWEALARLLHDDFVCRYVHTGEVFDRESWVQLNAEYPGFDHLVLQDCVGTPDRAAGRSQVTGYAGEKFQHFEVATFIGLHDGLIVEMTELWTDVDSTAPERARPSSNAPDSP